jgi:DNA-binding transcriptional MerR regulator
MCVWKNYRSIGEVSEMFGINVWTIRLWCDRFDILHPFRDINGHIVFASDDVERIGVIYRLTKIEGMTLKRVSKNLKSTLLSESRKKQSQIP